MTTTKQLTKTQKRLQERAQNPLESEEQAALFEWAALSEKRMPELRMMYHIPNGGLRNKVVAVRLTAQGVRRGVPDICLPVARGEMHGLYIELKRRKSGRTTAEQDDWIELLQAQGYAAIVCRGCNEAIAAIERYMQASR